jgi:hypothetical protein
MKIELDNSQVVRDLRPLVKAGWTATLQVQRSHTFILLNAPGRSDRPMVTVRHAGDACVYLGRDGDSTTFEGEGAIGKAVALALLSNLENAG